MITRTFQIVGLLSAACFVAFLFTLPLPGQAPAGQRGQAAPPPPPPAPLPTTGQGKLLMFADMALFAPRTPDNCILKSRYKRGEAVGWRVTAIDSGSGNPETSAEIVIHVNYMGMNIDIPTEPRMLGLSRKPYYPNIWSGKWVVPMDAPTGVVRFTITAKDKYGRAAEWKPWGAEESMLMVVE